MIEIKQCSENMCDLLNKEIAELENAMVEEIANILETRIINKTWRSKSVAREIYNAVYRKQQEGSVVITERQHEIAMRNQYDVGFNFGYKKGSKETAREFVNETTKRKKTLIIPYTNDKIERISTYWIYELAKQFGVEVEE